MKKFFIIYGIILFVSASLFGQDIRITGTVTDAANGETIPGASVVVKGTTQGSITDIDGRYEITTSSNAVLVFSFVGMKTKEVSVGGKTVINVTLESDMVGLEEVVVVGYGVQRREATTGAVSVVSEKDLRNIPVTSPEKLLQGQVAGLQLNSVSGAPGAATQIRIRGFSSINAGQEPLYVIDGVAVVSGDYSSLTSTGNIMASLNPSDIESITVLKDAAAASVYGSRASNGVIIITTKKGKAGEEARLNFRMRSGTSQISNDNGYRIMTPEEIYSYNRQALINSGFDPETYSATAGGALYPGFYGPETLPADVETFDWLDAAFRDAKTTDYELSVRGGTEKTSYYTSGNYMKQEGMMIGTAIERISFRSNVDQKVNSYLNMGTNLNLTSTFQDDQPHESLYYVNPFWASINLLPWHLPYDSVGAYNFDIPSNANQNFIASVENDDQNERQYRVLGSFYAELKPFKGLTLKTTNAVELMMGEGRRWWSPFGGPGETGTLQNTLTKLERYTTTNTANYMTTFSDVHNVRVLIGQEAFTHQFQEYYAIGRDIGYKIPYLNMSTQATSAVSYWFTEYALSSYFGIADYNYDDKYFINGSVRRDGNSRFGSETRWATFYSVGASWNLHREEFIRKYDFINMLKLRGSYGINGNDAIGNYTQYGTYGPVSYNGIGGMSPSRIPNTTLTWELNASYNVGLDFALFKDIQGTFEYYSRTTSEMLLSMPISMTSGASSYVINIGELKNTGIEGSLSYGFNIGDVNMNLKANAAHNKVEIIDLGGEEEIADGFWRRYRVGGGYSDYYVYDWAGVNPANGQSLYYNEDGELTPLYSEARRVYKGQIEPQLFGGFGYDLNWKGFSLNLFFEYKLGQYVYIMESRYTMSDGYNWGSNQNAALLDYWKEPGDISPNPIPLVNNSQGGNEWGTSRFLERGDYLRLKDLTLSYNLPKNLIKNARLNNVRLFVSGTNLYTWHDVSYWDPERPVTGGGYIIFPNAKTYSFGIEIEL